MSFFEDLGKKVQGVGDKIGKSTDTMRLNNMISDEERNINTIYYNMGRRYEELHKDNFEPEFAEFFAQIQGCRQRIEECRVQIRKNKQLVVCKGCGNEIPETMMFCTTCGTENTEGKKILEERAAAEAAARAATLCPHCGAPRAYGAQFCTVCGGDLNSVPTPGVAPNPGHFPTPVEIQNRMPTPAPAPAPTPAPAPAPTPAPAPAPTPAPGTRTCPNCGKVVPASNRFCTGCGTKLEG